MKKQLLTLFAALSTATAFCQSIPNGGFENWTVSNYEEPINYYTSNSENRNKGYVVNNVLKITDTVHGSYAVELNTILYNNDTLAGFIANGNFSAPAGQGAPYNQKPTGLRGYYQCNIAAGDTGLIIVEFKLGGSMIGAAMYKFTGSHSGYTPFFAPVSLPATPDTFMIAATSSNLLINHYKGIPGNMLKLDSVSFTGVATQPATLNGDFENWSMKSNYTLNGWDLSNAVQRTTDKHSGQYAIELMTINNGNVYGADATTGRSMPGTTLPQYPFSNAVDTLSFYYKYSPADPADSAGVILNFWKNHTVIGNYSKLLPAASSYTNVVMSFSLATVPDSVVVFLNSSKSSSSLPSSYNGADFKVDDIMFKSQQTPVTDFSIPSITCVNMPVQLSDNSSNIPTSYTWTASGGGLLQPNANVANPTITYTAAGTYTLTLVAANSHGSGGTQTKTITINPNPTLAPSSPDGPYCENTGFGNLLIANNSNGSTVTWNPGNLTGNSINATPNVTTTYSAVATYSTGCMSNTGTITVTVKPTPTVTVNTPTVCAGVTTTLTANGGSGVTYSWTSGPPSASMPATPSVTSVYTVDVTGSNGCVTTATGTIVVNPLPTTCIGSNNPVCQGQTITFMFCGSAVNTYTWTGPAGFTSNSPSPSIFSATPASSGIYTVAVTDFNGCMNSTTSNITVYPGPSVSYTATNASCSGCSDGTATVTANGGVAPYSYTWSPVAAAGPVASGLSPGTVYTVCATDANGCMSCNTFTISFTTGVDNFKSSDVSIYPNPSSGVFTINMNSSGGTAVIFDLTGKKVASFTLTEAKSQIDLSSYTDGIYFMEINTPQGTYRKKITKAN